ncbi:MAG: response regulator [Gemmatimonadetes bacterium]|nr:MAG: response regulator [Gemmatimonadota bacterium]
MSKAHILAVDDDPDILELIEYNLGKEGYRVTGVSSGEDAFIFLNTESPDLIILDLMLPGMQGMDVCRKVRSNPHLNAVKIIMLTAKGEESDIITGLDTGADDYMTKPFSPNVLLARVKAILRRRDTEPVSETERIARHGVTLDPKRHDVWLHDNKIDLTFTEYNVLHFLMRHPGWVFTRYQIVDAVRGDNYQVTDRAVDVQIAGLRKKLGDYGHLIETVRGVGYRFKE